MSYITCQHRTKPRKVNILFTHFPTTTTNQLQIHNFPFESLVSMTSMEYTAPRQLSTSWMVNEDIGIVCLFFDLVSLSNALSIFNVVFHIRKNRAAFGICKYASMNCSSIENGAGISILTFAKRVQICDYALRELIDHSHPIVLSPNFEISINHLITQNSFICHHINVVVWLIRPSSHHGCIQLSDSKWCFKFFLSFGQQLGLCGNWIEIAYGTRSGSVRVIVQHPETVGHSPQLFQTFTVHQSPVTKVKLSEQFLISVCSEYNHVRTWRVPRFRGMISTQPGSTPEASFKVSI